MIEAFFGWMFLREHISAKQICGIILGLGGVILMALYTSNSTISKNETLGIILIMISNILRASGSFLLRKMQTVHPIINAFFFGVLNVILGLFGILINQTKIGSTSTFCIILMIVSGIQGLITNILEAWAYKFAGLAKLAPMRYSIVVYTYIFDILWFGYWFTLMDIFGTVLVILGIVLSII